MEVDPGARDTEKGRIRYVTDNIRLWGGKKYRYPVLTEDVSLPARELFRQTCETRNSTILGGHMSQDQVHLHGSSPPEPDPSKIAP
ncbi:MAG TPA: hypothetical protein EYP19_00355 [Desulfobacterales bacterium]|nr:hypothetical protein [Desulfobacterales bacterium]